MWIAFYAARSRAISGAVSDQVRDGRKPQDRQGARPYGAAIDLAARRRGDRMIGRRQFITLIGGAAAWPLAASAQQPAQIKRVGVMMGVAKDALGQLSAEAFQRELERLGWT